MAQDSYENKVTENTVILDIEYLVAIKSRPQ
jgi:hypothetical protein